LSDARCRHRLSVGLTLAFVVGAVAMAGQPAAAQATDDAQQLADRYAPIVMVRTQEVACDADGEPFTPMAVERILDNPQIALRQLGNGDPLVMRGPSARDLAELGAGFYLDAPGDALEPECVYEQDHDRLTAGQPSVVYAHIVQEDGRPGMLALQYWLYWYYNDWNNKHESDWEFVQILFRADTVAEALASEPVSVGYAQHEGGESADWDDDKLRREGNHPIVYSSQRSHASYFAPATYLGRSASEGFGCDNTESPSTRLEPAVIVLPDAVTDLDDPQAWIGFEGRWGERHGGPNNGPTGPNNKPQWLAPLTWQDDLRDSSFLVPGGDTGGAQVVEAFCSVVGWGSTQYIRFVASPARVLFVLALLALGAAFLLRRTSWGVVDPTPLRRRRRAGEIARLAATECRRHPAVFAAVGLVAVPVGAIASLVGIVLSRVPIIAGFVDVDDDVHSGLRLVVSLIVGGVLISLVFVVIAALVAAVVDDTVQPRLSLPASWALVRSHAGSLLGALVIAVVTVAVSSVTVVGLPLAAWFFVRSMFIPQAVVLESRGSRDALARSGALVRGRWLHTAVVTVAMLTAMSALGVAVGLVLLVLFTGLPLWALSAAVAACNVVMLPVAALVMTYLYGDAVTEHDAGRSPDVDVEDLDRVVPVAESIPRR
jgi:hypothetical protein